MISIHAYIPLLKRVYNYSSSPNSPLHWFYFNTRVVKVLYFHPFIVILICLPALRHLNIQKIFFMDRIVLPKYCFSIANVVVTSFTELVHMYYPEWLGECSSLRTQRCKNNLMRRWNCKPSSFTRVTSCESYGSSLLLKAALIINITKGEFLKIIQYYSFWKKMVGHNHFQVLDGKKASIPWKYIFISYWYVAQ